MPDVYTGDTGDGYVFNYSTTNAATTRGDASTTGIAGNFTTNLGTQGVQNNKSARAGGLWWNFRSYFTFVLTGESGTVDSCDLVVYMDNSSSNLDSGGITTAHSRVIAVASTGPQNNDTSDYGKCFSSGSTLGTALCDPKSISSTAGYHTFPITGNIVTGGLQVINDGIGAKPVICLMDYTWDYLNADIGGTYGTSETVRHSIYYTEYTGTSRDPYLSITYTSGVTVTHNATFFGANF